MELWKDLIGGLASMGVARTANMLNCKVSLPEAAKYAPDECGVFWAYLEGNLVLCSSAKNLRKRFDEYFRGSNIWHASDKLMYQNRKKIEVLWSGYGSLGECADKLKSCQKGAWNLLDEQERSQSSGMGAALLGVILLLLVVAGGMFFLKSQDEVVANGVQPPAVVAAVEPQQEPVSIKERAAEGKLELPKEVAAEETQDSITGKKQEEDTSEIPDVKLIEEIGEPSEKDKEDLKNFVGGFFKLTSCIIFFPFSLFF